MDGVVEESSSVIDRFGACCFGGLPKNITFDNLISAHTPARQIMFALLCKASTFTLFLYCGWVITVGPIHHGGQTIHGTLQPCMLLLHGAHLGLTRRLNHMMYANEPKIFFFLKFPFFFRAGFFILFFKISQFLKYFELTRILKNKFWIEIYSKKVQHVIHIFISG